MADAWSTSGGVEFVSNCQLTRFGLTGPLPRGWSWCLGGGYKDPVYRRKSHVLHIHRYIYIHYISREHGDVDIPQWIWSQLGVSKSRDCY